MTETTLPGRSRAGTLPIQVRHLTLHVFKRHFSLLFPPVACRFPEGQAVLEVPPHRSTVVVLRVFLELREGSTARDTAPLDKLQHLRRYLLAHERSVAAGGDSTRWLRRWPRSCRTSSGPSSRSWPRSGARGAPPPWRPSPRTRACGRGGGRRADGSGAPPRCVRRRSGVLPPTIAPRSLGESLLPAARRRSTGTTGELVKPL